MRGGEGAGQGRLTPEEIAALGTLAELVDCRRVWIHRGGGGRMSRWARAGVLRLSGGRAVALGNHVFLPDGCAGSIPVLAHELTHCGQYQRWGALRYVARGLADRLREVRYRLGRGPSPYDYSGAGGVPFEALGMEQQGQVVEDCFRGLAAARAVSPYRPPAAGPAAEPVSDAPPPPRA